jgi:hypothetical protein
MTYCAEWLLCLSLFSLRHRDDTSQKTHMTRLKTHKTQPKKPIYNATKIISNATKIVFGFKSKT